MNLSFAGCGFLGIYHVGVAVCFRKYAPQLLLDKISGASAGAIAACCLLCDLPIDGIVWDTLLHAPLSAFMGKVLGDLPHCTIFQILGGMTSDVLRLTTEARSRSLGPFSPSFNIQTLLLEGLEKFLPEDAHLRVNGKLHISLTRVYDGKNVIVSQFNNKEELMQALLASSFIPVFSGIIPPKFQGVRYVDGGFSNNLIALDENTITVSPFCGESDICPRDNSSQLFHINFKNTSIELSKHNICRIARILFPPKPEVLSDLCKQGFDDALRFLHRNNLISCTRCLAVQSTFVVAETLEECIEYDPECKECKMQQEEALVSNMPEVVLTIFQEAIDSANKGLINWIFKHRGMKLLSVLSLPYTLPADVVYATFTKIMSTTPAMGNGLWTVSKFFLDQLRNLLNGVSSSRQQHQHTAKIRCQLAYTEYGGNNNLELYQQEQAKNKMNLNLTLNLNDSGLPAEQTLSEKVRTRVPNFTISRSDTGNEDTFEHILQATAQNDAIMAYFYMDENKVKVTEIFDVTESDAPGMQSKQEIELNDQLQFEDDWDEATWAAKQATEQPMLNNSNDDILDFSIDDIISKDMSILLSDPESEWSSKDERLEEENSDRPESEQINYNENVYRPPPYVVPSFNYDEFDI